LTLSHCSACTEKTKLDQDEDQEDCEYLSTGESEKRCFYNSETGGCVEKACKELSSNLCKYFKPYTDDETCASKSGNDGCEIIKCSELSSDKCNEFYPHEDYYDYKCVKNGDACKITPKTCEDYKKDECNRYYSYDREYRCVYDDAAQKCKEKKCEELSKTECSKFKIWPNSENDQNLETCAPFGDKCKIQKCSDFTSQDTCEIVTFSNEAYKCTFSGGLCTLSNCRSLKSNCGSFIPLDPLYKCVSDEDGDRCYTEPKDCEELSKGQCDLFNTEKNLEDTNGKKCVEEDGKCTLHSKNLEISALLLSLLLFLF
jgi:hypothetical protein